MIEFINNYLVPGLILGSIYALGAIGVSMIYSILRFAHFAHGDLMTFGAYLAYAVVVAADWPPLVALPIPAAGERSARRVDVPEVRLKEDAVELRAMLLPVVVGRAQAPRVVGRAVAAALHSSLSTLLRN